MSNIKAVVAMGPVAATSISLALIEAGGDNILVPVLQAPGASGLMLMVGVKPEGAEEVLKLLSAPVMGDLMLARMLEEHSAGTLKPEVEAELNIMYGPQPIDSALRDLAQHFDVSAAEKPTLH